MRSGCVAIAVLSWLTMAAGIASAEGSLTGQVKDRDSGEELIAVDVVLVGAGLAAQTDLFGRYSFDDVLAGAYSVRFSYLGYNTRVIDDVREVDGETRRLDAVLESYRANAIDDIMITGTRILSTEGAVLADRKQAAVVGDAISAAQISRSPDGQAGDALKRVTGLLVDSGGYVNVRGMPDRYNVIVVDGAVATSVDPDLDRKSFNFEMIPSNLLSSLQVFKTALPDMPGDFTGGFVRVNTFEFPESQTTQVSIQSGWSEESSDQVFFRDAHRGSADWYGRDDGGRDRPAPLVDAGRLPSDTP
ncbi:MAG: carboxypeptidase regulatory-like domain-containing protein [Candidatus Krumholzibacteria bacterium]|nr:carboxypeptidase regulatory-like domain-containing protein [Candidatus Krumholzibacteria bacterium]